MRSRSKFIFRMIIVVVLVFASTLFACHDLILSVQDNKNSTIKAFKEEQYKVIWNSLKELQIESRNEVTKVSNDIEDDLLDLPENSFLKIQNDMSNGTFNETLHNIFVKNTENHNLNNINNHRNGIIIMYNDGYLEDFNYRRAKGENTGSRNWDDTISSSYNSDLEKNAIDKLLNRTSGIIALESYDLAGNKNHIKIKELNYNTLLNVYLNEGIEGLRNYQILVPYYITDIGDIFGVPDISQGIKVKNNKIIVVQEFNLYDQVMLNKSELFTNTAVDNIEEKYVNVFRWYYLIGFLMIMSVCLIIFIACFAYNSAVDHEEIQEKYKDINSENTL